MALTQVHCHVLQASVVRETDLEGRVTRLICPELDAQTGSCRLRRGALDAGPLGQLLERITEDTLAERGTQCVLQ
ncbi:MAG: hypothetical protein AB7N65_27060 [Vicinamibacterales bacterium]